MTNTAKQTPRSKLIGIIAMVSISVCMLDRVRRMLPGHRQLCTWWKDPETASMHDGRSIDGHKWYIQP